MELSSFVDSPKLNCPTGSPWQEADFPAAYAKSGTASTSASRQSKLTRSDTMTMTIYCAKASEARMVSWIRPWLWHSILGCEPYLKKGILSLVWKKLTSMLKTRCGNDGQRRTRCFVNLNIRFGVTKMSRLDAMQTTDNLRQET